MNRTRLNSALWGLFILLIGVAVLLYNFGVLDAYRSLITYVVAGALALAGAGFLILLAVRQDHWYFAIPGLTLLALGGVVYLATQEQIRPEWLAALFLGGVVFSFLLLFLSDRAGRWWALLQAGTVATVGIVALLIVSALDPGAALLSASLLGAALFGGFALSFLLLYLFVGDRRRFLWALVMAGVLGAFAMVLLVSGLGEGNRIVRLWPVLLIVLGGVLVARLFGGQTAAPAQPTPATPVALPDGDLSAAASGAPARIIRPESLPKSAAPAMATEPAPAPPAPPASTPPAPPPAPLPDAIANLDASDPAAALDALLEASKKAVEG